MLQSCLTLKHEFKNDSTVQQVSHLDAVRRVLLLSTLYFTKHDKAHHLSPLRSQRTEKPKGLLPASLASPCSTGSVSRLLIFFPNKAEPCYIAWNVQQPPASDSEMLWLQARAPEPRLPVTYKHLKTKAKGFRGPGLAMVTVKLLQPRETKKTYKTLASFHTGSQFTNYK